MFSCGDNGYLETDENQVADLDGDGDAEILTAAYENTIVVGGTGKELWRLNTRGRYSTCPAILECEGQSPLIYAGDNKGMFTCLDGGGDGAWQRDMDTSSARPLRWPIWTGTTSRKPSRVTNQAF